MKRDNSGILFRNNNKKTDKHPDWRGNITVDGQDLEISAWERTSSKGEVYQSLSVRPPREQVKHEPIRYGDQFEGDVNL